MQIPSNKTFIFTTLAKNQTRFFVALALELQRHGHQALIISFHEESCAYAMARGVTAYNVFENFVKTAELGKEKSFSDYAEQYAIPNPNLILGHEQIVFGITDVKDVMRKYCEYFSAVERIFKDINAESNGEIIVVQELGGFSSLLSIFYFSLQRGYRHFFIEPSFFKGRIFFVQDSLCAPKVVFKNSISVTDALNTYLDQVTRSKQIRVPFKDRRGYKAPIAKLFNFYNLKRLVQKLYSKFIMRQQEEFSYIWHYVWRHINMTANRLLLGHVYSSIPEQKFVYFPMHVPNDVSLTIRSPEYFAQLSFVQYLSRNLPLGYVLVVKEHPAMRGDIDRKLIKKLLRMNQNIVLLKPTVNNFDVLRNADAVVTINSKAGAEALLCSKPVVVLGDAFYTNCPYMYHVPCLHDLPDTLRQLLNKPPALHQNAIRRYFQNVWDCSYEGELYDDSNVNVTSFCKSLLLKIHN